MILDNLGVHHCQPVKPWLAQHKKRMAVFYLPSYRPELNPEEHLNAGIKQVMRSKVSVQTNAKRQAAASEHMTTFAHKPERVKSFFSEPFAKYAD